MSRGAVGLVETERSVCQRGSSETVASMKVLVVEDYAPIRTSVAQGLTEAGFSVDVAVDGEEGWWLARTASYDVLVLDLMLPKVDGWTILRRLRDDGNDVPVLVLTARDAVPDRVRGLDMGADDYLVKPFAFEELLARVRALVRRKYHQPSPVLKVADLEIDQSRREVRRAGKTVPLTAREYAILEYLALNAGRPVSRTEIWEHVYDFNAEPNSNVIDVYIAHLRRRLRQPGRPDLIRTQRGFGYVLVDACPQQS